MRLKIFGVFLAFFVAVQGAAMTDAALASTENSSLRPKVGLVLSGGGARGLAHIGVLKALEELSIPVDCITATSMGALVGGGYAAGYSASEIEALTLAIDWKRMFSSRPDRREMKWRAKQDDDASLGRSLELGLTAKGFRTPGGLISTQELTLFLRRSVQFADAINDFSDLPIPFRSLSTDLLTGNRVVLSRGIPLSEAMLASMSIPGVFSPVKYKGMLLCDGCLVDNLPVQEARAMGAERLIVINVGTPLFGEEELENIPGIMAQVVNILTEQNVQRSLAAVQPTDDLIVPDLARFTAGDFEKAHEIIAAGYAAVMAKKDSLAQFRVSEPHYRTWRAEKKVLLAQADSRRIERIEVAGNGEISQESIIKEANLDISKPVRIQDVEDSVRRLWGTEHFEKISYRFRPGRYGDTLVFEPEEWPWGQSNLKFGGSLETDFMDSARYALVVAYTRGALNRWGGEWLTQVQFGDKRYIYTELYQPLGAASPWFVRPFAGFDYEPYDVYRRETGDHSLAEVKRLSFETGIDLGVELGRFGRIVGSLGWKRTSYHVIRGDVAVEPTTRQPFVAGEFAYDTLDDVNFPRTGAKAALHYSYALGSSDSYCANVRAVVPVALDKNWTTVFAAYAGRSKGSEYYSLGGLFSLSGSPEHRYVGQRMMFGAVRLSRQINDWTGYPVPMYVGATLEVAKLYNKDRPTWSHKDNRWIGAGSVFFGADTWIGPVFVGLGHTLRHGTAVNLYWGRVSWW